MYTCPHVAVCGRRALQRPCRERVAAPVLGARAMCGGWTRDLRHPRAGCGRVHPSCREWPCAPSTQGVLTSCARQNRLTCTEITVYCIKQALLNGDAPQNAFYVVRVRSSRAARVYSLKNAEWAGQVDGAGAGLSRGVSAPILTRDADGRTPPVRCRTRDVRKVERAPFGPAGRLRETAR